MDYEPKLRDLLAAPFVLVGVTLHVLTLPFYFVSMKLGSAYTAKILLRHLR